MHTSAKWLAKGKRTSSRRSMEQSLGLSLLYALGVAIWFVFLFVVGLVAWKTEKPDRENV